jgi:hypothetical protein
MLEQIHSVDVHGFAKGARFGARSAHCAHTKWRDYTLVGYYDGLTSRRTALASYFTEWSNSK